VQGEHSYYLPLPSNNNTRFGHMPGNGDEFALLGDHPEKLP
jgi:hypothetical protein